METNWIDLYWGLACLGLIIAFPLFVWAWLEHRLNKSKLRTIDELDGLLSELTIENDTLRNAAVRD